MQTAQLIYLLTVVAIMAVQINLATCKQSSKDSMVKATAHFGLDFIKDLPQEKKNENVIMSPISLHTLLEMLLLGLDKTSGLKRIELENTLYKEYFLHSGLNLHEVKHNVTQNIFGVPNTSGANKNLLISIANMILTNKDRIILKSDFKNKLQQYYKVKLETFGQDDLDGGLVEDRVNDWVKNKTNNMINKLLEPKSLNPNMMMILLNAVHFKGQWLQTFFEESTSKKTFYNYGDKNKSKEVDFMRLFGGKFNLIDFNQYSGTINLNCTALQMSFKSNGKSSYSMVLLLPKKYDGLVELEKKLDGEKLFNMLKGFDDYSTIKKVNVEIPKFEFEESYDDVKGILKQMGVKSISGDISGLFETDQRSVKVDQVLHKAKIRVDEFGAEAAAVSSVISVLTSLNNHEEQTVNFVADHPFLFIIMHDESKMPLFLGRVTNF